MSRKQDDVRCFPSRDRHDDDLDHDFYFNTRARPRHGGGGAREEDLLLRRPRPSLSPQKGPRTMGRDPRSSISLERRSQYEQHIDCGRGPGHGHGHVVSRSPQIEHSQKRAHVDERGFVVSPNSSMRIQGEYLEYRDYDNSNTRPRNTYGYEDLEVVNHKDYSVRKSGASGHHPLVESIPFEDIVDRDVELLHPNYRYAARHMEPRGGYSTMDVQRLKDDKIRYQDMIPHEKLVKDVYYKDGEQYAYYSRECSSRESPLSQIKDLGSKDLLKNNPSNSTVIIARGEHITKLQDCHTKSSDGYPKRYGKDLETFISDDYGQIVVSDTRRGYGPTCRDAKCHACEAYKSSRVEHNDNMYHEIGARRDDEIAYTSQENMFTKTKYVRENRDMREFLRQDFMDSTEIEPNTEGFHSSQRIIKNVGTQEYDAIQKDMALDYGDTRQSSDTMIQPRDYLDSGYSHVEIARKASNHHHIPDLGSLPEYEFKNPRLGKVHGRYAPDVSNRIRVKNSSDLNNLDTQSVAEGYERIKADDPRDNDRFLKRKYIVGEDVRRVESRGETHSKCNMPSGNDDFHDYPTEWTSRKTNIMRSRRPSGYECSHYVESEEISDGSYHHKDSTIGGWTSYHDQSESIQEHSEKPFKMESRHLKGYKRTEFSKSYGHMCHSYPRSNHYKHQDLRQKYENYNDVAIPAQAADMSDNHVASWKSEPSEDSADYKQRIQSAFLDFSKRFNENPTARKLYKEEGKAGSLFCVVCRRSASKEFLDTKALATHAFMSHKVGVRPQHLGLHRAICVLMGWNTMPDPNTGTWAPEQLPRPEALEQKEDLILWPPVVIVHNISLSNNDHNKWKLVNIDALEEFLRGKGFHLGKMKICLGNPGDHSVILVKFLGTFSGLQEAERLHKLFMERKHGRVEFDQAISGSGPADDLIQGADQSEKLEDVLLYGYMGISEDLDNIDFDTKKRCSVKSKKEIHELADAPVKPE